MKKIKINVKTKTSNYPIIIGSSLIEKLSKLFDENLIKFNKCLLIIDNKIPKNFINKILKSLKKKEKIIYYFNASEKNKNMTSANKILDLLLKKNFHRNDCLISIGGGITGDVSGFASSIFKRGMTFDWPCLAAIIKKGMSLILILG